MGVKDLRRRMILAPTPRAGKVVRHPAAGPGLDGSGDGGGAGAGPPHYRALGVGLRLGPDIRAAGGVERRGGTTARHSGTTGQLVLEGGAADLQAAASLQPYDWLHRLGTPASVPRAAAQLMSPSGHPSSRTGAHSLTDEVLPETEVSLVGGPSSPRSRRPATIRRCACRWMHWRATATPTSAQHPHLTSQEQAA